MHHQSVSVHWGNHFLCQMHDYPLHFPDCFLVASPAQTSYQRISKERRGWEYGETGGKWASHGECRETSGNWKYILSPDYRDQFTWWKWLLLRMDSVVLYYFESLFFSNLSSQKSTLTYPRVGNHKWMRHGLLCPCHSYLTVWQGEDDNDGR